MSEKKKLEQEEVQCANTEPQTEPEICDENQLDNIDYNDNRVIRLAVPKFGTYMVSEEVGPAGEAIIKEAVKQIKTVDASECPLPMEYVFRHDASTVFFGDRFETKRDISLENATLGILAVMDTYGIACLAIARYEDHAQILYGRDETFEFMKYLPIAVGEEA